MVSVGHVLQRSSNILPFIYLEQKCHDPIQYRFAYLAPHTILPFQGDNIITTIRQFVHIPNPYLECIEHEAYRLLFIHIVSICRSGTTQQSSGERQAYLVHSKNNCKTIQYRYIAAAGSERSTNLALALSSCNFGVYTLGYGRHSYALGICKHHQRGVGSGRSWGSGDVQGLSGEFQSEQTIMATNRND